jgi:peptidoglycan/LPS O-acetylase OafA/YrhL
MYLHHIGSPMGFFFTLTRLDPIAVGALVALHPGWFRHTWIATPVAVWLLYRSEFEFVYLALALSFGSVVMRAVTGTNRLLSAAPLRFIGKISYGIYIFHPTAYAIFWLTPFCLRVADWPHANLARMAGQVLFPIPFAAISWYLFEKPLLGLKKYFAAPDAQEVSPPARVLAAGAGD